ncbi:MarR family transcriptional regulator [Lentzea sp. NBRC 105346]|uniref:MarR family winged helix-turn-helix transcriptional regulator n=1 Tax=Lentzea sp. NBRC 105346 TaxID=3032205 RepID=UPI0024A1EC0D|nr:MarR family transcriptional regulator [Lentzea sp. NBRC 105346]GLZ35029.1 MarR family transcriptional regulator [Lentzea sp. NBRC 105346]
MDKVSTEVVALFAQIVDRYTKEYEQAAAARDLTSIQAKVLAALDEPQPMHVIASKLGSERSNVTGIIDRLQARGLVERRPDERDRRVKYIVATEEGRRLALEFRGALRFAAEPLAALGAADRRQLRDLLRRMLGD